MQKLPSALFGIGLVVLLLSVVIGWIIAPIVIEGFVAEETRFYNGSYAWKKWTKPTNVILLKVYLFNVSNPDDVIKGETPIFQELGPYIYEEQREKYDIHINEESDTIQYKQKIFYYFRRDLSVGDEDEDVVTTINIPLAGVANQLASFPTMIRFLVGMYLMKYREPVFVTKTVSELVFKGYKSKMVNELQGITGINMAINNTVGLFYHRNGTDEGTLVIKGGNKHYSQFNEIVSFNGKPNLDYWKGDSCNKIQGTDANSFPPFITKKNVLHAFHPDVCKTVDLVYAKNIEVLGIPGYRFTTPTDVFDSEIDKPENECFCVNPGENREGCYKSGVQSMAPCQRGAPVTISLPHFLHAPYHLNKTIGLHPVVEEHSIFVDIEPTLGILLQASKRGQVNVDLKPARGIEGFDKVPTMQFPILWQDEYAIIDDETYNRVKSEFQLPLNIFNSARWAALAVSCVILSFSVSVLAMRTRKKDYFI